MGDRYDIVVAGGGLAGTFAAVAAARLGKRVLLLEETGCLGGTLTGCGVGPMMTGHAGERQVICGLFEELTREMEKQGFSCGHVRDTTGYVSYLTPFSSEGMKYVLDQMAVSSGVEILFHVMAVSVKTGERRIREVSMGSREGILTVQADVFIDATGDGNLAYFAGAPMRKGRETDGQNQPMTMNAKYINVDRQQLLRHILEHIGDFPRLMGKEKLLQSSGHLAIAGFSGEMEMARREGVLSFDREELLMFETDRQGEFIVNTTRITGKDGTGSVQVSLAEIEGRKQCRELDCFLKRYIPGFQHAELELTGPSVGIRGSRQLCGAYCLTAEDVSKGRIFDSRIALAAYPIDIHNPDGSGTDSSFKMGDHGYYSIPYEILFCEQLENLLVTGRCVSASFAAQAAIRTTPTTSAMGQAAGVAAALSLDLSEKRKGAVGDISRMKLQEELRKQKVIL